MKTQVKSWGNSHGIRLSKEMLQEAGFSVKDILEVKVSDGVITLEKNVRHKH